LELGLLIIMSSAVVVRWDKHPRRHCKEGTQGKPNNRGKLNEISQEHLSGRVHSFPSSETRRRGCAPCSDGNDKQTAGAY